MCRQESNERYYRKEQSVCLGRVSMRARGEGEYESYDGSRSPHTSRWRCARVAPSKATEIIHAATIIADAKIMCIVVRSRQEMRPLDVNMASYHCSYQLRFNHLRSCTSASAYISHDQQHYQKNARVFFSCLAIGCGTHLATTRVVSALDLAGLRADGGQTRLELCEDAQRFRELVVDLW